MYKRPDTDPVKKLRLPAIVAVAAVIVAACSSPKQSKNTSRDTFGTTTTLEVPPTTAQTLPSSNTSTPSLVETVPPTTTSPTAGTFNTKTGKFLLVSNRTSNHHDHIYEKDLATKTIEDITPNIYGDAANPEVSPDGKEMVFYMEEPDHSWQVGRELLADPTHHITLLTSGPDANHEDPTYVRDPVNPNKFDIAYKTITNNATAPGDLSLMDDNGNLIKDITGSHGITGNLLPDPIPGQITEAWKPVDLDGRHWIFGTQYLHSDDKVANSASATQEINIIDVTTGASQPLTQYGDGLPHWYATELTDGRIVDVTKTKPGAQDSLATVSKTGGKETPLIPTTQVGALADPSAGPGNSLLFLDDRDAGYNVDAGIVIGNQITDIQPIDTSPAGTRDLAPVYVPNSAG